MNREDIKKSVEANLFKAYMESHDHTLIIDPDMDAFVNKVTDGIAHLLISHGESAEGLFNGDISPDEQSEAVVIDELVDEANQE